MELQDKVVVVTGAAGALGRAVTALFGAQGARLTLVDLDGALATLPDHPRHHPVASDLRDAVQAGAVASAVVTQFGRIDILCNVAGGFMMGRPVHLTTDEDWQAMLDANFRTALNMSRAVLPIMLEQRSGHIVNVSAAGALTGKAEMAPYCVAKSAVIRLTESISAEVRHLGINVNCVLPSIIDSEANRKAMPEAQVDRWVAPEALAEVILFLSSARARALHGCSIPVVGLS